MQRLHAEGFSHYCFKAHESSKSLSLIKMHTTQGHLHIVSPRNLPSADWAACTVVLKVNWTAQLIAWDQYWISPTGATKRHISSVGPFELSVYVPLQAPESWWHTNTPCVSVCLWELCNKCPGETNLIYPFFPSFNWLLFCLTNSNNPHFNSQWNWYVWDAGTKLSFCFILFFVFFLL